VQYVTVTPAHTALCDKPFTVTDCPQPI